MWDRAAEHRFSAMMGLRRELSLCRGMRQALTEDEQRKVAGAIVEQLESTNRKIEQGPMPGGHSELMGRE
jgi:hypothetical protein